MSEPYVTADRQDIYALPPSVGLWCLAGVVLFWAMALCGLLLPFIVGERALETGLGAVVFFLPLGWYALDGWRRRADYVQVGSTHITLVRASGSDVAMRWDEIVEMRERPVLRRLELLDRQRRVLRVEFQLTGFARLRELVQERAPVLRDRHVRIREFRRYSLGRWPWVVLYAFLVGFAFFAVATGDWHAAAVCVAFTGLTGAWAFSEIRSVVIGQRDIVLQRLVGARNVPYDAILRIEVVDAEREGVAAGVIMVLRSGEEIKLQGFLDGYLALSDALSAAWSTRRTKT